MSSETPEFITSVRINKNGDDHICGHCERTFRSNRGLNQHLKWCKQNMGSECEPANGRHEHIETSANAKVSTTTSSAPQKSYTWGNYPSHVLRQMYNNAKSNNAKSPAAETFKKRKS